MAAWHLVYIACIFITKKSPFIQKGSDHQCSLEPADLANLVKLAKQRLEQKIFKNTFEDMLLLFND